MHSLQGDNQPQRSKSQAILRSLTVHCDRLSLETLLDGGVTLTMRFRLTALFLITAIAGFAIHCVHRGVTDQPIERLMGALIVLYTGTLTTILLSATGSAIGGRVGAIAGLLLAVVAWCGCLWIVNVFEERSVSALAGTHLTFVFAVSTTTVWVVLNDAKNKVRNHALDDHSVTKLLTTQREMGDSPGRERR